MKAFTDRFEEVLSDLEDEISVHDAEAIKRLFRKADNQIRRYQNMAVRLGARISPSEMIDEDNCPQWKPAVPFRARRVVRQVFECPRCTFSNTNERLVLVHFRAAHGDGVFSRLRKDRP